MLGLPFSRLKWVAGAVGGQAGVSRRVSGRGMGLQSSKTSSALAKCLYSTLAGPGLFFASRRLDAVSRCREKLLHVAVLSSELCCRTSSGASRSLRAAASITDFLAKPVAQQAQQTDAVGPWPPAGKREKRGASAAPAAAAGAVFDWPSSRSGRYSRRCY